MGLKSDLESEVGTIFRSIWTDRDGTVIPDADSVKLNNDAVKLTGTVLYADMADSTKMVDNSNKQRSAESYKAFLHCAAKIIRSEGGSITAYDGDRIMAVYLGGSKNTSAVRTAMKIRWVCKHVINPKKIKQYSDDQYPINQAIGIDTSDLYVANTGVRGAKDLVWVGRSANYAAKLAALPAGYIYVTPEIYKNIADEAKLTKGRNMWEACTWNTFENKPIYRSNWSWAID